MTSRTPLKYQLVALDVPDAGALRVLIVADDPLARGGLAALFDGQPGYALAGSVAFDDTFDEVLALFLPDVALWDLGFRDSLAVEVPDFEEARLPVVALVPDASRTRDAWAAGARGLLLRDAMPSVIATALVAAQQGLVVIDAALADAVLALRAEVHEADGLTPREREVLDLLAEGLPNKLIADRLGVSEHTVKFHVGAVLSKLGVQSRTEAVIRAARLGLLML